MTSVEWRDSMQGLAWFMDRDALRSRYTPTEQPEYKPELEAEVEGFLAGLTDRQRDVVQMHGAAGLTWRQISEILEITPSCVRYHWEAAVSKITGVRTEFMERVNAYNRRRYAEWRKRNPRKGFDGPVHGRNSTYTNYLCKCDLCVEAHAQYQRDFRDRKRAERAKKQRRRTVRQARHDRYRELEQQTGETPRELVTLRAHARKQRDKWIELRDEEARTGVTPPALARYREQKRQQKQRRMARRRSEAAKLTADGNTSP